MIELKNSRASLRQLERLTGNGKKRDISIEMKQVLSRWFRELIENGAALLIEELNKTWPKESVLIDENFVPSDDTKPAGFRTVVQNGEKSVYIENNTGTISIN